MTPEKVRELLQRNSVTGDWRLDGEWLVSEWNAPRTSGRIPLAHVYHAGELMAAAPELAAAYLELAAKVEKVAALADKWEHGALRWADPLPVPPEVGLIRETLGVPR